MILLLVFLCQQAIANEDYYTLVDSAELFIKNNQWERAEEFLLKILRTYPDDHNNSLVLSNLATVQRYQGKYSDAINNYSFAINMTPNAVTLLKNRASLYLELDSVVKALDDYGRIILIDEKDEESRYYHGILSLRTGDLDAAKNDFDYILFYNPNSGLGKEGIAHWYKRRKDYIEAVTHFSDIIKQYPNAIYLSNRAECYLALKRLNEAEKDIRKAIEMSPEDGYLYVLRAKLHKTRFEKTAMDRDIPLAVKYGIDRELAETIINSK